MAFNSDLLRAQPGFSDWMAECAFACKMGDDYLALEPFEYRGKKIYYWPAIIEDGIRWQHGFSDSPMRIPEGARIAR